MLWLPACRLTARLSAPARLQALVAALAALVFAVASGVAGSADLVSACVFGFIGLMGLDAAVRADPRRAFLPRRSAFGSRRVEMAIVCGVVLTTVSLIGGIAVLHGVTSFAFVVPLGVICLCLIGLGAWLTQLPPSTGALKRRPVWSLLTALSEDFSPPPSPLYARQRRVRRWLVPAALIAFMMSSLATNFGGLVGSIVAGAPLVAIVAAALWLVGSEVVAVASGVSPTSPWRARSWFDEHFTRPERYQTPTESGAAEFEARVADSRLWLTLRHDVRALPFWPRDRARFADGAVEARVEPGFAGAVGVVARWQCDSFGRVACYVGWIDDAGGAGISLMEPGHRPAPLREAHMVAVGENGAAVRMLCVGPELQLEINGRAVVSVSDDRLDAGRWGAFIGAPRSGPASAALDALAIVEVVRAEPTPETAAGVAAAPAG